MRICRVHWDKLIQAVKDEGLWGFVKGPEEASTEIQAALAGDSDDRKGFDPLLRANNMICDQALNQGGLYMLEGDRCPVCEAMKHLSSIPHEGQTEPVGEAWVENHWTVDVVKAIRIYMGELGLLPPLQ